MPREELPHQVIGRDILRRFSEERKIDISPWPSVTAAMYDEEDDFGPVLARPVGFPLTDLPVLVLGAGGHEGSAGACYHCQQSPKRFFTEPRLTFSPGVLCW